MRDLSLRYSPIDKSPISQIYPWHDFLKDVLYLFYIFKDQQLYQKQIKKRLCLKYALFLDSGRSAISLALKSLKSDAKNEVIITAFNCPAVIDGVIASGCKPIFVDINNLCQINIKDLKNSITSNTLAVIVTNTYGVADNLEEISKICIGSNIYLLNDLAQVCHINSGIINKYGDVLIYSFGPEKCLYAGGGGILAINNNSLINKINKVSPKEVIKRKDVSVKIIKRIIYYIRFKIYCTYPSLIKMKSAKSSVDIKTPEKILPKQMNIIQLAILTRKLKDMDMYYERSLTNLNILMEAIPNVIIVSPFYKTLPLYLTFIINSDRYKFASYLNENKIASTWNYLPLYYYDAYKKFKQKRYPLTELLWKKVISIPFRYPLEKQETERIASVVKNYKNENL